MNGKLYYKRGRRYIPTVYWEGFPAPGVWLVQKKPGHSSEELILKIGDVPELYPFAQMMVSKDDLVKLILRVSSKQHTTNDLATEIIKWLASGGKHEA
jgi:hypothetical protein